MEEQIRKHERTIIELKRARNALLNISILPPEVLGDIFRWNVTLEGDFGKLEEGSRNFLFVCHHWSEVAFHTPEVWSFWGNTPTDWARWYRHSGSAPLDLVLGDDDCDDNILDITLRNVIQDRAARDTIRRVHLRSWDAELLSSIVFRLSAACEGLRSNGVESFILSNEGDTPVDVSKFFAHYRFPKLQRLGFQKCTITSWDLLMSRTTVLTSLTLRLSHLSPRPTTSQLLSILASNPSLQKISLSRFAIPDDGGGESPCPVSLHRLKELKLSGGLRHVIGLLHRLEHPPNIDLAITLYDRTAPDIAHIVGPYIRDYLQRRDRSQGGLGLSVIRVGHYTTFRVANMGGIDLSTRVWDRVPPFVSITLGPAQGSQDISEKGFLDLIPHIPRHEVVSFYSLADSAAMEDMSIQFQNLRALHSCSMSLLAVFPESNLDGNNWLPPSLQHVVLERPTVDGGDWSPLTTFLACRASSGNRLDSLAVVGSHMCPRVEGHVRSMVQEFRRDCPSQSCPFGTCPLTHIVLVS